MHFVFIPYGKRSEVELLLRDMEAQKHLLNCRKGFEHKGIWIQGQVRFLPFGIYEYVFPKEDLDIVLNTLMVTEGEVNHYNIDAVKNFLMRKFVRCEKIPKYKRDKKMLWIVEHVNIIPLGVRYDKEITEKTGQLEGFTHEAI